MAFYTSLLIESNQLKIMLWVIIFDHNLSVSKFYCQVMYMQLIINNIENEIKLFFNTQIQ